MIIKLNLTKDTLTNARGYLRLLNCNKDGSYRSPDSMMAEFITELDKAIKKADKDNA